MAGEIDYSDEIEETDRPQISSGYFNEEGDRISKIPPSVSKKGLLKSSVRETKYTGESEASRKRYTAELSTLLCCIQSVQSLTYPRPNPVHSLLLPRPNYLWQTFGIQSMIILSVPTINQNNLQINFVGPHIETLLLGTETGKRLFRDLSMLVSKIPRPVPLPKNLSDLLMKQENVHEKKKAIASGSQPPVAQVTSAARKQAELLRKKREDMTAEQIKRWVALAAVKIIKQSQGKGSKSGPTINISTVRQPTPPRSIRGSSQEMSPSSAATSKESSPEKQDTSTRIMSESPLQLGRNPQSKSPVWPTNNAKVTAIPGKENQYNIELSKEQDNLLNQLTPQKRIEERNRLYS